MHIARMSIGAIPPISERITMEFDEHVNVFTGPNASGKSTVLLALANHFNALEDRSKRPFVDLWEAEYDPDEFDDFVGEMTDSEQHNAIGLSEDWVDRYANLSERSEIKPIFVHIGSVRIGLPGVSAMESVDTGSYTAAEVLNRRFSGAEVQRAFDVLGKEAWEIESNSPHHEERRNFMRAIGIADACSMSICNEVIRDSSTHNYVPGWDLRGYIAHPVANLDNIRVIRGAGINTNDVRDFGILPDAERPDVAAYHEDAESVPIYLGHLSSGTEGTLLWIRWLALKMVHHHGFKNGWEKQPAFLLIDEIENHLHPTWQRRVIPALLDHFPGLQIFATTHSPFVVAGLKAGQVHMLKRDGNGVVTASSNEQDIIGWTTDEILRTFMGVDEPTDQLTIDRAQRLRELRGKDSLTDEEAVEMAELRRQVNADFLSSVTPLGRERERLGDMMLDFLHSRQSELSQDGDQR